MRCCERYAFSAGHRGLLVCRCASYTSRTHNTHPLLVEPPTDHTIVSFSNLPHGQGSLGTLIFSIFSYGFAMGASVPCFYLTLATPDTDNSVSLGLLTYKSAIIDGNEWDYACVEWSQSQRDELGAMWKAAAAFGIIANISTGITVIAAIIMTCLTFSRSVILGMVGFQVLASISALLTFLAFGSETCTTYSCKFSTSAGLAIGASLISLLTALLFYKTPPGRDFIPGTPMFAAEAPGTITVQETVNPDGTKRIVKTTVNADGSKTVEETVEHPQVQAF